MTTSRIPPRKFRWHVPRAAWWYWMSPGRIAERSPDYLLTHPEAQGNYRPAVPREKSRGTSESMWLPQPSGGMRYNPHAKLDPSQIEDREPRGYNPNHESNRSYMPDVRGSYSVPGASEFASRPLANPAVSPVPEAYRALDRTVSGGLSQMGSDRAAAMFRYLGALYRQQHSVTGAITNPAAALAATRARARSMSTGAITHPASETGPTSAQVGRVAPRRGGGTGGTSRTRM